VWVIASSLLRLSAVRPVRRCRCGTLRGGCWGRATGAGRLPLARCGRLWWRCRGSLRLWSGIGRRLGWGSLPGRPARLV